MTQDPYRLDNEDVPLSADTTGTEGEYDGLDEADEKAASRKLSLFVTLAVLLALAGGTYFAYEMYFANADLVGDAPKTLAVAAIQNNDANPVPPAAPADATPAAIDPATGLPVQNATPAATPGATPGATPPADAMATSATASPPQDANAPATATAASPAATAGATPPATSETPVANAATSTAVAMPAQPAALPPPAEAQLQPVATPAPPQNNAAAKMAEVDKVMDEAHSTPALPMNNAMVNQSLDKAANTKQAVNDILGGKTAVTPGAAKTMAKQVEVTSRASQVIFVKKNYSAQSPQAINAAGDRVLDAGEYSAAADIYNKQLKKNPSDPSALAGKAMALQKAGQDLEAMNTYERLLSLNPRDIEALTNYLGLLQKQNPDEAMNRLNGLAAQYPDNAAILGQLGMVHAGMMDTPQALMYFQKAMALDPNNPTYPFNIAVLYDRLGTSDKAFDAYKATLALAADYPTRAGGIPLDTIRARLGALH